MNLLLKWDPWIWGSPGSNQAHWIYQNAQIAHGVEDLVLQEDNGGLWNLFSVPDQYCPDDRYLHSMIFYTVKIASPRQKWPWLSQSSSRPDTQRHTRYHHVWRWRSGDPDERSALSQSRTLSYQYSSWLELAMAILRRRKNPKNRLWWSPMVKPTLHQDWQKCHKNSFGWSKIVNCTLALGLCLLKTPYTHYYIYGGSWPLSRKLCGYIYTS